jgi:hypothetical protein
MKVKKHRESIPKMSSWRATNKLELAHSNICDPINPESNCKKRHFITFIDDFIMKTWIYLLSEKSYGFEVFQRYRTLVEKESGYVKYNAEELIEVEGMFLLSLIIFVS